MPIFISPAQTFPWPLTASLTPSLTCLTGTSHWPCSKWTCFISLFPPTISFSHLLVSGEWNLCPPSCPSQNSKHHLEFPSPTLPEWTSHQPQFVHLVTPISKQGKEWPHIPLARTSSFIFLQGTPCTWESCWKVQRFIPRVDVMCLRLLENFLTQEA